MASFHVWTIGCQMNKADSDKLSDDLLRLGFVPEAKLEDADVIVLNSCSVRQSAENRIISKLGALKPLKKTRPEAVVALAGCMVDDNLPELRQRFPMVDVFCKPQQYDDLLNLVAGRAAAELAGALPKPSGSPVAFVPVIQGCDNFCSYCIVPYRRGREKSRPLAEIVCEVERLVAGGVREVTLLGQNVDSYGKNLPDKPDLADLLAVLEAVPALWRIRFLTSHPKDMTDKLIATMARSRKVCEHINLPVQAGDDQMLKAMRRGYTVEHYRDLVARIRAAMPEVGLSTDVIVGFPGETEAQYKNTLDLLASLRFDTVHVAAYSPRPGTAAARLPDNIPAGVKKERLRMIEELQEMLAKEINADLLGKTMEILVECRNKGKWQGRTRTNKLAFFASDESWTGRLAKVRIESASAWSLQGTVLEEVSGSDA